MDVCHRINGKDVWVSDTVDELDYEKILVGQLRSKAFKEITKIKVHFKGFSKRYDEVIEAHDFEQRVASVQLNYAKNEKKGPSTA